MWLVKLWSNVWMTGSTTITVFRSKFPHSNPLPEVIPIIIEELMSLIKSPILYELQHVTERRYITKNYRRGRQCEKERDKCILLLTKSSLKSCACFSAVLAWSTIWLRRSWSSNWAMSGLEPFVRNLVETPHGFTHFISSVLFWEFITGALCTDSTSRITNALPNPGNKNNHIRFLNAFIMYIVIKLLTIINKLQWNSLLLYAIKVLFQ